MKQAVRKILGRVVQHLPAEARRKVRDGIHPALRQRVVTLMVGSQPEKPKLSVIVPVYNVEAYLKKCLNSIISQTYRNLEIIVVNDGSPDGSVAIAEKFARWDKRVKVITKKNAGLGAARNTGLEYATGDYVTFVDSDDRLVPDAYEAMMDSLLASGSDLVVAGAYREKAGKTWLSAWTKKHHFEDRIGITIEDYPAIFEDAVAWNKVWRMEFFRAAVKGFPEGVKYEDQEPSTVSYLRARTFDILQKPVYYWLIRDDGSSISQGKEKLDDLTDRLTVLSASTKWVMSEASAQVKKAWFRKLIDGDLIQYLQVAPRTNQEYWDTLSAGLKNISELMGDQLWAEIPFWTRLPAWFASRGDKLATFDALLWRSEHGSGVKMRSADHGFVIDTSEFRSSLGELPENILSVESSFLEPNSRVTGINWIDDFVVHISGYAHCEHVIDGSLIDPVLLLVSADGSKRVDLKANKVSARRLSRFKSEVASPSDAEFSVRIDTSDLDPEVVWNLTVQLKVGDESFDYPIGYPEKTGAAPDNGFSAVDNGRRWYIKSSSGERVWLVSQAVEPVAELTQTGERSFVLETKGDAAGRYNRLKLRNRATSQELTARGTAAGNGSYRFEFSLPPLSRAMEDLNKDFTWRIRVASDRRERAIKPAGGFVQLRDLRGAGTVNVQLTDAGNLSIVENPWKASVSSYEVGSEGDFAKLQLQGEYSLPNGWELSRVGLFRDDVEYPVKIDDQGGRILATVRLAEDDWDGNTVPLPNGGYHLKLIARNQSTGKMRRKWFRLEESNVPDLPAEFGHSLPKFTVSRTVRTRSMWLSVSGALPFAERGAFARAQAIRSAVEANSESGLNNSILFECFNGRRAGDNVEPLYRALRKQLPGWDFYWSNAHERFAAPEGATSVTPGSSEYIRALLRSRILVNNAEFPAYYRKQPGQFYVQTWHGTPLKMIGNDIHSAGISAQYRAKMRRETRYWDVLLAQSDFAAEKFASAFSSTASVVIDGYPRNDVLADASEYERVRGETRSQLGIAADDVFVLYAPTFRDSAKDSDKGYRFDVSIDFEVLRAQLPQNTRFGLRAHTNIKTVRVENREAYLDVTDYPDTQRLLTAADVLITDYSSLMFDFAASRKPMVFYAPDLEDYLQKSRGMYLDYESTVPGPIARSPQELSSALRTVLEDNGATYSEQYSRFVERFLPYDDGCASERIASTIVRSVSGKEERSDLQ